MGYRDAAAEGAAAGGFLQGVGPGVKAAGAEYHDFQVANETSKMSADFAKAQAALGDAWRNTIATADPNDPDTAARFQREVVEPTLDSLGENVGTREARMMFERQKASLQFDLFTKTNTDHAELAGLAAVQNAQTVSNQLTNSVMQNPTMWQGSLVRGDLAIDALPGLTTEQNMKLKQAQRKEIASAAILGFAHRDPNEAKAMLGRTEFNSYLDAKEKDALGGVIDRIQNAQEADARAAEAGRLREQKQQFTATAANISGSVIQLDPDGKYIGTSIPADYFSKLEALSHAPQADDGTIRAMVAAGQAILKEPSEISDPNVFERFRTKLGVDGPDRLSLRDLALARADRQLSDKDAAMFHQSIIDLDKDPGKVERNRRFNDMMTGLKGFVTSSNPFLGIVKAPQDQKFYEFARDARELYDAGLENNKPLKEIESQIINLLPNYALNKKDALGLIRSYTGPGGLTPAAPVGTGAEPRKAGESAADYLKRTGGL